MKENCTVCVIGAGPAGTATAIQLRKMGHQVTIIEAASFPRPHVGICLSDETYPLIDYLGVREDVDEAGFFQRNKTLIKWGTSEPKITLQPGFHVDRGVFDRLLLERANKLGATIIQPGKVLRVTSEENGWRIKIGTQNKVQLLDADFVIDASGKGNVLPGTKKRVSPPLTALHGKWKLTKAPDYDGFIEAGKDAWLWFAQTKANEAVITLFTAPKHFSKSKDQSLHAHYHRMLDQFSILEGCQLDRLLSEVETCDASSRASTDPVGENYIRVGDSNFSVDPMASQGVHLALSSAIQAAVVVNTLINYPENKAYAKQFYHERQNERVENFTQKTASVYYEVFQNSREPFWKERSTHVDIPRPEPVFESVLPAMNELVTISEKASFLLMPVMRDNYITAQLSLHHPNLNRPVAYLGGIDLSQLLKDFPGNIPVFSVLKSWEAVIPETLSRQILGWLYGHGILEPSKVTALIPF